LLSADRVETNNASTVDDEYRWSLSQAHELADYVVSVENSMVGISQEREWELVALEELRDPIGRVRRDRDEVRPRRCKSLVVGSQLREMPSAEWSGEPSKKHDHNRAVCQCRRQAKINPVLVSEHELGSLLTRGGSATGNWHSHSMTHRATYSNVVACTLLYGHPIDHASAGSESEPAAAFPGSMEFQPTMDVYRF
jgi:hypothetical protein